MTSFYLLCFVLFTVCDLGRSLKLARDRSGCDAVISAVRGKTSFWKADASRKVIQWNRPKARSLRVPPCVCDPEGGELGNVSSIKLQVVKAMIWNSVCSGCPGQEVPDAEYRFSTDAKKIKRFGPCRGITIYRCSCPPPTTTTITTEASETTEPTAPMTDAPPTDGTVATEQP